MYSILIKNLFLFLFMLCSSSTFNLFLIFSYYLSIYKSTYFMFLLFIGLFYSLIIFYLVLIKFFFFIVINYNLVAL